MLNMSNLDLVGTFLALLFGFVLFTIAFIAVVEGMKKCWAAFKRDEQRLTIQYYRNLVSSSFMHVIGADYDSDEDYEWA